MKNLHEFTLPRIIGARETLIEKLKERIRRGKALAGKKTWEMDYTAFLSKLKDAQAWSALNYATLQASFDEPTVATAYDQVARFRQIDTGSRDDIEQRLSEEIRDAVRFLISTIEHIELLAPASETQSPSSAESGPSSSGPQTIVTGNKKVFIVHGHDVAAKESLARFIAQIGMEPIILHEQASEGNTVIEKFEKHSDVHFAVVLLTPDDLGSSKLNSEDARPRARQNVIFELGYFVGRLGRHRVCALHKGDVDVPSDYHGIVYLPLDDAGAWKLALVRDMKAAGIDLDMNRAL